MSAALPSPPTPSPGGHPLPVEALQDLLGGLLHERERLREDGSSVDLEENRRKIVGAQWQLAHALIALHMPGR
jgi:hypothetical protein